jgi:hypothetical protein
MCPSAPCAPRVQPSHRGALRPAAALLLLWLLPLLSTPLAAATHDHADGQGRPAATVPAANSPHIWEPKTKSVAVFKNGLGFFTRQGTAQLRDGWCYAREVPPAAFGTLAIYAHGEDQTVDLVGSGPGEIVAFDGHDAAEDAETKRQRLEACKGLKIELHYEQRGEPRSAAGTLVSIGAEYVVLEAVQQTLAVPVDAITKLQVLDLPLRIHVSQEEDAPAAEAELGIAYLRTGIMWIPEYTLKVLDDETAELTLRGTLVNEAEDLVHCDVNFVVGVPHFVHSELMSPIAVGRVIRTLGSGLPTYGVPPQVMSQMMNRAAIANNAMVAPQTENGRGAATEPVPADRGDLSDLMSQLPQLESAAAGDFTVYTKRDLTVRRGERAIVTLFTHKIPYSHLYRWETSGAVEHFLKLDNTTPTAWTTGPCLALSDGHPLSEDVLKYTPRGGSGELQVTTAINIAHSQTEEEVDRQLKAHEPRNNEFFDRVTIAGTIRLKNFEEQPAEILITAPIEGRPSEADHEGVIRIDATRLRLVERAGVIRWRLTLQPGEATELNYRYERYVPSN